MTLAPETPLPTRSSSYSRTTRVIEELQVVWDALQKDLVSVRSQLESAREAKKMHDQQSKSYVESNQECRHHIQALMALLESKQQGLQQTKQVSTTLETQAKQLKDAAVDARAQADTLKKQETQLGQEKETTMLAKARVVQQHKVLHQALQQLDQRAHHEHTQMKKQLAMVQSQLDQVIARNQLILLLTTAQGDVNNNNNNMNTRRQAWIQHVRSLQQQLLLLPGGGMDKIRSELDGLLEAASLPYGDNTMNQMVTQCQDEVHGLIQRIQSYSLIVPQ
ncbi:hypothetical protein BCR42DRAFT_350697 [Absidia repens]|uniref:SWI5-dependent HO expression protein 3 n=1 Tax=Absidia repens TaxID=90262 RepID=A0A1X2IKQ9_9FUNG|nr:hypothetical protein BCR42DRAFT_350697 [Absidia repens]